MVNKKDIFLILNDDFGEKIIDFSKKNIIWIVSSKKNDFFVKKARDSNPEKSSITQIFLQKNEEIEDLLLRSIYDIEDHHKYDNKDNSAISIYVFGFKEEPSESLKNEIYIIEKSGIKIIFSSSIDLEGLISRGLL